MRRLLSSLQRRRLPVLLQTEGAECGLVCLGMISTYWGLRTDVDWLRKRFSLSLRGVDLHTLSTMARDLGFQTRALRVGLNRLTDVRCPCILHWGMNHFVVLKSAGARGIVIHDPVVGERRISLDQASNSFTGIALELMPAATFVPADVTRKTSLRLLMGPVVGMARGVFQLIVLGLLLEACALAAPLLLKLVVDQSLAFEDHSILGPLAIGFTVLAILQVCVGALRSWVTVSLSALLKQQWLANSFHHLMQLPVPYFEKRRLGDIVSRFNSIHFMQRTLTTQSVESLLDGVLVVLTAAMMVYVSLPLASLPFVAAVLYALSRALIDRRYRLAIAEGLIHMARQDTHFLESVRGVQAVKLFNQQQDRAMTWVSLLTDQLNAEVAAGRWAVSGKAAQNLFFYIERVVVIYAAATLVLREEMSLGSMFAFLAYKEQFITRTSALIDKLSELLAMRVHAARVGDIVTTPVEEIGVATTQALDSAPEVRLQDVWFRYSDAEPWILQGVTLNIKPLESVAIVGASGGGKTTLVKLVLGLLEPSRGVILINGVDLKSFGLRNYRGIVGAVMQQDQVFSGSIADNIGFFDPNPDLDWIRECAGIAHLAREIEQMPMRYETLIGDIGTGLSGGQVQRILLARALYRHPKILVLDEATSHLDIASESAVSDAIKRMQMTRLIVAHRPETVATADRVYEIVDGVGYEVKRQESGRYHESQS